MTDLIVVIVLFLIIGAATAYIVKAKKRGVKCIGCPAGTSCSHAVAGGCSGCGGHAEDAHRECSCCHTDIK